MAAQLGEAVGQATAAAAADLRAQTRAGIRGVLWFTAADPRRGRVLLADPRANSVLAERRSAARDLLYQMVVEDDEREDADDSPVAAMVAAALYTGALSELVRQWLAGRLGSDIDSVVGYALARMLPEA